MDALDLSYRVLVSLAGALVRACAPGLPAGWQLRLGATAPELPAGRWVWLHAVSVGELLLADGLLVRLREAGHRVHLSTSTPAGLELLQRRLPDWDGGTGLISGGAFPLDDSAGLESFLLRPPGAFIALETELWPGLLEALEARGVPRLVVNGRLTEKSLERGGPWLRRAASRLSLVAARDEASADAFRRLGAPEVALGGNLKADLPPPRSLHGGWAALRTAWAASPVLVAGNTLDGEEELLVGLWSALRERHPGLRLILAPRQPRRFEAVAAWFSQQGLAFRRASAWTEQPSAWTEPLTRSDSLTRPDPSTWPDEGAWQSTDVLLLDTLGELPAAYAEGTVALVAGGWTAAGGHNPLEPVRAGLPTLIGPGCANFGDLVPPLLQAGLLVIAEVNILEALTRAALAGVPLRPGGRPQALPESLRGALDRTWGLIAPHLPRPE